MHRCRTAACSLQRACLRAQKTVPAKAGTPLIPLAPPRPAHDNHSLMRFVSAISDAESTTSAAADVTAAARDRVAPAAPLIGGMASSGRQPRENALLLDDEMLDEGLVGVSLSDGVDVQTIVSQGARPIGSPMLITKAKENIIQQLGGRPPLA